MSTLQHHHFSMGLIDQVRDSRRVMDELSKIIDGLWAEVRKLKEEADPVVVATVEARVSEMIQQLDRLESQLGEAQCQEKVARGRVQILKA
ncbi:hypothetical protein BHE74_00012591 [Ensete ventricosum]|nr:hypothetical protein GW17_00048408 [Ensete ventricosum]RWW79140.1 hypothetical protein BHE74_00012591 [Ensete ventricosum]